MTTMVRTAGMANGTPDWQLDRMYETETEKILEQQYNDDFPATSVVSDMSAADYHIGQALMFLYRAAGNCTGSEWEKVMDRLTDSLEAYRDGMRLHRNNIEGGKTA